MNDELHVIFGTGPVGCWIGRTLVELGIRARAVNRSGTRPPLLPDEVEIIAADASNPEHGALAAHGASVVYQALSPSYHRWLQEFPSLQAGAIAGARFARARLVSIENLYMYGQEQSISETTVPSPRSHKGDLRWKMAEAIAHLHQTREIKTVSLRSSDYYGPGVLSSAFGDRFFGNLVRGKNAQLTGSADRLHSIAYIEDVARAAVALARRPELFGRVWLSPHASPRTQRQIFDAACKESGHPGRMTVVTPLMMRVSGIFIPDARASVEMLYQFTEHFIVDSAHSEEIFGISPTPLETGLEHTIEWYRATLTRKNNGNTFSLPQ